MTRRYCDVCEDEIQHNVVSERIKESTVLRNVTINFEIMVGVGGPGKWNNGDLCKRCLYSAMAHFDPRERAAKA